MSSEVEQQKEKEKDRINWRRSKVQELSSQGHSQREIAQLLQVSNGTVNKDLFILRQQAKTNIKKYIDERLPEEYEKCMIGLNAILKETWTTSQQAKECYSMKLDLLTNATIVDDAIRFVSQKYKGDSTSSGNKYEVDKEESSEPDYDEDRDQLKEETGEITTINQAF